MRSTSAFATTTTRAREQTPPLTFHALKLGNVTRDPARENQLHDLLNEDEKPASK